MDAGLKHQLSNLTDREKVKLNRQLLIYLLFLAVSILFWYLNALSKEYTTVVSYPVKYEDFPKGKVLASDLPKELDIKVKGFGFTILRSKLVSYINPVILPINIFRLDIQRKDNQYIYYLLSRYTKEWIGNQLGSEIQLVSVLPDTLFFKFTDVVEKKVPVQLVSKLDFAKQFMQNGKILIRPDSVVVSGPQVVTDTLKSILTNELDIKGIKDTVTKEISLSSVSKISFTTKTVFVTVPAVKYTEMVLNIPIEVENVPDSLRIKTFPTYISLSCWVGLADYDKMTPFLFRATVDYHVLKNNSSNKVKVNLTKIPAMVNNITYRPKSVEYIIEK
jgi:hypothetical protein